MEDLRDKILDAIQEIKADSQKKIFTLSDISKKIIGVKKKLLSNEINKLISDDILEIVVYEPIYMALKEDVKYFRGRGVFYAPNLLIIQQIIKLDIGII